MTTQRQTPSRVVRVGVLADPEGATADIASYLGEELPQRIAVRRDDGRVYDVQVRSEPLPVDPGEHGTATVDYGARRCEEEGWDVVVCLTDLPLRRDGRAVVSQVASQRQVAVVSLPAFGALRLQERTLDLVVEILADLVAGARGEGADVAGSRLEAHLPGPFEVVPSGSPDVDLHVVARRGRLRLLVGMVRDNRPWRLAGGLRSGIVAAFAFSAFYMISSTVWELGASHSLWRLGLISAGTVLAMVVWLIAYHRLWLSASGPRARDREQAWLFNASTVLTLTIGVGCAYVGLLVINLAAALLVLPEDVLARHLESSVGFLEYLKLTWLATSGASVAGALGTGFDTEHSIRQAAYSRRESERRQVFAARQESEESSAS